MSILFDASCQCFHLSSQGMSYIIQMAAGRYPLHLYWGASVRHISDDLVTRLSIYTHDNFSLHETPLDRMPQEAPVFGCGDLREGMLHVRHASGTAALDLVFQKYEIRTGTCPKGGLPRAHGENSETLVLTLADVSSGIEVELTYTLWEDSPILARHVRITNNGTAPVTLERALSCCVDFEGSDYRLLTLSGAWARERHEDFRPLVQGNQGTSTVRGASSVQTSPFMALLSPDATEENGDVYAMALCYSGSFLASVDVDQDHNARAMIGIQPFDFSWALAPGASFDTPEAYLCYSHTGLSGMSHAFHTFVHHHINQGPFALAPRPLLINNWEATYFQFNEEKLLDLARTAKKVGIDLFVLDDGWFGHRDSDNSSLGDWYDDLRKLPHGLSGLSDRIHELGLLFGLWVEPEMISPDSDLYRAHPDWCIHAEDRMRIECRHQLVLDLTRQEVRDAIVASICGALARGKVDYVKWDMNRNINMVGSAALPPERMKEFHHRYILGLYDIVSRVTSAFPKVLFESCAGGGGRFDLGMACYMPQNWTSDDTDAWERCLIQHSTSYVFPPSMMGAHVSAVPNHQTGRITPLASRAAVAMGGTYGYELDLNRLTAEELSSIRSLNERVHAWQNTLLYGTYHRLLSPYARTRAAFMTVSEDRKQAVVTFMNALAEPNQKPKLLKLRGLDPDADYRDVDTGKVYGGDELMSYGIPLSVPQADFTSQQFFLTIC